MLFRPVGAADEPRGFRLFAADVHPTLRELAEVEYFAYLRELHNIRNPHAQISAESAFDADE